MTNYEFVDLDGDGIKEIVGERSYCQILLRDGTWEEQFCEPYESETHRYNGVKYGKDLVEEKSPRGHDTVDRACVALAKIWRFAR